MFISHACQGWTAWEAGQIDEEFDPVVFKERQLMEIRRHVQVGLLCVQQDRTDRPTMADVLQMLSGKKELPTPKKPMYTESYDKWRPASGPSANGNDRTRPSVRSARCALGLADQPAQ